LIRPALADPESDRLAAARAPGEVLFAVCRSVYPLIRTGAYELDAEPRALIGLVSDDF